jgi:aminoglycoside phosphotransferase family enzyme
LVEKVRFLSRADSYCPSVDTVAMRETHMSWLALAGDRVFKLKKPVHLPYLDFSTLERREAACRAELALNRRLAPEVYLDVVPLTLGAGGLAIGGGGRIVDWLVMMRRLDERETLEARAAAGQLTPAAIDRVATRLCRFFLHASRRQINPDTHLAAWRRAIVENMRVLLDHHLDPAPGTARRIAATLERYLRQRKDRIAARLRARRVVDGHGDLRPEHIWLTDGVVIIDCIEFNPSLRALDPLDEVAYLDMECERLGDGWAGPRLRRGLAPVLRDDDPTDGLYLFYRSYRGLLRARLSLAHLSDPHPRTPQKWLPQARDYLRLAGADAVQLDRLLRTP